MIRMIRIYFFADLKKMFTNRKRDYIVINNMKHPDNAGRGRVGQDTPAQEKGKAGRQSRHPRGRGEGLGRQGRTDQNRTDPQIETELIRW